MPPPSISAQQVQRLGLAGLGGMIGRNQPGPGKARNRNPRIGQRHGAAWCSAPARSGGCAAAGRDRAPPCRRSFRPARAPLPHRHRLPPPGSRCSAHNSGRRRPPRRCGSASPSRASSRSPECGRDGSGRASRRPPRCSSASGLFSMRERRSSRITSRSGPITASVRIRLRIRSASNSIIVSSASGDTVW